jgi:hypothetical protein
METNPKKRTRVNFSVSVKGVVTPDVTIETYDETTTDTLKEATKLLDEALQIAKERTEENTK